MGEVLRWADVAMYSSESMRSNTPTVRLVSMNADPLGDLASMWAMYAGREEPSLWRISEEARSEALREVMKTRLKAPLESIKMHFLVSGVTRAWTHQVVRQRTAVYAQESLRFAVVEDEFASRVALPPSIAALPPHDERYQAWFKAVTAIQEAYRYLINNGIPAEDARGLLPTNITTRLHWITDLRNLLEVMGNRLCTQAQFEWRAVALGIVQAIHEASTDNLSKANGFAKVYRAKELANIFRPICYFTGKCEFMANLDRHCVIRERVQTFHEYGVGSEYWESHEEDGRVTLSDGTPLEGINPREWLANPRAAVKAPQR